jgi:hypothetical protein
MLDPKSCSWLKQHDFVCPAQGAAIKPEAGGIHSLETVRKSLLFTFAVALAAPLPLLVGCWPWLAAGKSKTRMAYFSLAH